MAKNEHPFVAGNLQKLEGGAHRLGEIERRNRDGRRTDRCRHGEKVSPSLRQNQKKKNAPAELLDEFFQLKERHALLAQDVQNLVHTLSEMFPLLATREQVDALTDGVEAVINSLSGR